MFTTSKGHKRGPRELRTFPVIMKYNLFANRTGPLLFIVTINSHVSRSEK